MKVKDLLYRHSGKYCIYQGVYDENEQWNGYKCIADHETILTDEIKNLEVEDYTEGRFFLIIFTKNI